MPYEKIYIHHPGLVDAAGNEGVEAQVPAETLAIHMTRGWQPGRLERVAAAEQAAVDAEQAARVAARAAAVERAINERVMTQPNAEVDSFGQPLTPLPERRLAAARAALHAATADRVQPTVPSNEIEGNHVGDDSATTAAVVPESPQSSDEPTTPEKGRTR